LDLELAGKVALVTGSSRGIGRGIAQALFDEGCQVIINGRDEDSLRQSAKRIGEQWVAGDVCNSDQASKVVDAAQRFHGRLDIVVANVGSGVSVPPGTEDCAEWSRMLNLNLQSSVQTVSASRLALAASGGAVLCISSICGISALGAPIAYSAAKAALNSYVRGMSTVLAREGIRINGLAPGNVCFTGSIWERKLKENADAVQQMLNTQVSLGRLGSVREIADVAAFLCSPKASFMTGTVVVVDGGQIRI
jgi:3-oxoacyl-[acyl-carrier protein] reductase